MSAVCHGLHGLLYGKAPDGQPIIKGKRITGFTNSEEEAVGKTHIVPHLLEDSLKVQGAKFERGEDWASYSVADGLLITGQNPQSSEAAAQRVVKQLGA